MQIPLLPELTVDQVSSWQNLSLATGTRLG